MFPSRTGRMSTPPSVRPSGIRIPHADAPVFTQDQMNWANVYPMPDSIAIQASSNNGEGAANTQIWLLNQDILSNITNNSSGAGSITYTYQDAFEGKVTNELISRARGGVGAVCYGFSLRIVTGGSGSASNLAITNPVFLTYNAFGRSVANDTNIVSDQTRSDYDSSIGVFRTTQNITRFTQMGIVLAPNSVATVTLYFTPNFKL